MTGVLAALGAAMAWTGASALWRSLSGRMTAIRLTMKNGLASLLFLPVLFTLPRDCAPQTVMLLLLSGLIGIAAGDSFISVRCGDWAPDGPPWKPAVRCWPASLGCW